ncbi:MAG: mechanosensitive ion channel [Pseudomonadales bacterium]
MFDSAFSLLRDIHPALVPVSGFLCLLLVAWLAEVVLKGQLIALARRIAARSITRLDDYLLEENVVQRAAHLLPAFVIHLGVPAVPGLDTRWVTAIQSITLAAMAVLVAASLSALLNVVNRAWLDRPDAARRPIKGYVQVTRILLVCLTTILVVSALMGRSPLLLLSGLGAITAILLLVFKDTILSLVASVQISGLDMVRVGDWIEMPQFNADGDVIDVALHTVRVQNWDKTITTIPTHRLISDSFRNWRGMSESGGRRIKRALLVDMSTVRFLTAEETSHFTRFALLRDYIAGKLKELADYNAALDNPTEGAVNLRRLTNLGTFRAYVYNYLKHHPSIRKDMTLLVRQLQPQPEGLPIEVYCFTATTNWNDYENIQADIFDHLLAILDEFGLRAYQQPSGSDIARALDPTG